MNTDIINTKKYKKFLFLIFSMIIINGIADATTNYFTETIYSTGNIRAVFILVVIIIGLVFYNSFKYTPIIFTILLLYLFIRLFGSSDFYISFVFYAKFFIPFFFFAFGVMFISSIDKIILLNKVLLITILIINVSIWIAQIFKLGVSNYIEDSFFLGGADSNATYTLALFLSLVPIYIRTFKNYKKIFRILFVLLIISSITIIFLELRRISILALLISYLIFFINTKQKSKFVRYSIPFLFAAIIFFLIFFDIFIVRFEARTTGIHERIETQARYSETLYVLDMIDNAEISELLFGKELFNSANYFGERGLHIDYNVIFFGSGFLGLFLYLYSLFYMYSKFPKKSINSNLIKEIKIIGYSMIVLIIVIGFSRGLGSVGFRSLAFLYTGASIGITKFYVRRTNV